MEINLIPQKSINVEKENSKENVIQYNNLKKEKGDNNIKLNTPQKTSNKRSNDKNIGSKKSELCQKVSKEDLQKLCDQLSTFNERIRIAKDVTRLRYDLPSEMREKLETEAEELECLYVELQDAAKNLETIRNQRAALGKEKILLETKLGRLKAEAVNELEMIVSVYDSNMMERWMTVKSSNSIQPVENFLYDVKGKLEAMKNLQVLGSQKLSDLRNQEKKKEHITTKKEKKKINKEERESGSGQSRSCRSGSNIANYSSQSSFLMDTDSEDTLDDSAAHNVLYSLVYDQVLSLPAWTHSSLDID